ncbi:MAG: septation regulator SpoVG [Clostridia bacterium]|nr:septation regulator SpoVG [Clostridia bacterium]
MKITDVKVKPITSEGKMKAVVSVTFDDCFVVRDIKIIEGQDKLFIAMPSRKMPDGGFRDIAHPINAETREMIESTVIEMYHKELLAQADSVIK